MQPKDAKYYTQVFFVFRYGIREYEYIVKIYSYVYPNLFSEYPCHEPLKGGWCVAVTLLHDMRYKCAEWHCE